jgi:hypothetical protein
MNPDQYRDMMELLENAAEEREKMREILLGDPMDPSKPGLAIRIDRVEREIARWQARIAWIGSGGLVGVAGGLVLLWKILGVLGKTP